MHVTFEEYDPVAESPTKHSTRQLPRCIGCGRLVRAGEVFTFGDDGLAHHEVCPRRLALHLIVGGVLSDDGRALLAFVRSLPDSATCEHCAAAYLDTDRHGSLKAIRELILGGHVSCRQASCAICHEHRIVLRQRPAAFE